jgi:HPr kinase/phosphorylase
MCSGFDPVTKILHGTAVTIGAHGVLLTGASGAGKSDIALRLIDRGALLISDDAVSIDHVDELPWLAPAPNIEGKIEVRGIGICLMPNAKSAVLRLVVDLVEQVERMPEAALSEIDGFQVPSLKLMPFEISAAIKVELALRSVVDAGLLPVSIDRQTSDKGARA